MADRTVSSDYTLTADEDWTGDGKITIASGATVNLAGHTLTVAGLDGGGTITNIVTGFTNLATDTSKASCSDGITSVDTSATAGRAFENTNRVIVQNINSYWPFSVTYDFGEAKVINSYSITASSANNYYNVRGPGEWTLYGSNDGENWTGLGDKKTASQSDWKKGGTRSFDLDNSTAYRYYKITISKSAAPSANQGGYIEFKQIQYGYKPMGTVTGTFYGSTVGANLFNNNYAPYSFDNTTTYSRYRITFEAAQQGSDGYFEAVQLEYFSLKATQGELQRWPRGRPLVYRSARVHAFRDY